MKPTHKVLNRGHIVYVGTYTECLRYIEESETPKYNYIHNIGREELKEIQDVY